MMKVIFVCTGGTCRSPMAEHILKWKLKQRNVSDKFLVSSAGISAEVGQVISPNSVTALKKMGIKVSKKQKSQQLKADMLTGNALIITVSEAHKQLLKNLKRVYSFSDFDSGMDLPDPYGLSQEAYDKVAKIINFTLEEVVEKLISGKL